MDRDTAAAVVWGLSRYSVGLKLEIQFVCHVIKPLANSFNRVPDVSQDQVTAHGELIGMVNPT